MAAILAIVILLGGVVASIGIVTQHMNPSILTTTGVTGAVGPTGATGSVGPQGPPGATGDVTQPLPTYSMTSDFVTFFTNDGYSQTVPCILYAIAGQRIVWIDGLTELPRATSSQVGTLQLGLPAALQLNLNMGLTAYIGRFGGIQSPYYMTLSLVNTLALGDHLGFYFVDPDSAVSIPVNPYDDFNAFANGANMEILIVIPFYTNP